MRRLTRLFIAQLCAVAMLIGLAGCVPLTLAWTDLTPNGPAATPPILGAFGDAPPVRTIEDWAARRPLIQQRLEEEVYGEMPAGHQSRLLSARVIDQNMWEGRARLEEFTFQFEALDDAGNVLGGGPLTMVVLTPRDTPITKTILMQTFCPNSSTMPFDGVSDVGGRDCKGDGFASSLMSYVFGRYIATPPLEMILEEGIAVATIYPSQLVPDNKATAEAALARIFAPDDKTISKTRLGTIGAWGVFYGAMMDVLLADERFAGSSWIAYGHSRYGKAALVGAAYDPRIDGVIAHQSGAGGASLNKGKRGETVAQITKAYPHWFAPAYADFAGREEEMSIDQHHLMALLAPRPVFLGNARRDVWSDPNASFEASIGANAVYHLYGRQGLTAQLLQEFNPQADVSFFIRPGTHGVTEEDWPAFLAFVKAHF